MNQLNLELDANEEYFFSPWESGRSNLSQRENPNLKYQATKQSTGAPSTNASGSKAVAQSWSEQLAKVVTAYKDSARVGKVGVALLQTKAQFKMIVFKTKLNVLATLTLQHSIESSQLYWQNHYLEFYDDAQSYWSLFFDSPEEEHEFITKLQAHKFKFVELDEFETQFMQMLLTDNRTQNTVMSMNMNILESKIEKFLDRIDVLGSTGGAAKTNKEDEILELEEKVLDLKKENRKLKLALDGRKTQNDGKSVEKFRTAHAAELQDFELNAGNDWEQLAAELIENATTLSAYLKQIQARNEIQSKQLKTVTNKLSEESKLLAETKVKLTELEAQLKESTSNLLEQQSTADELQDSLQKQA